MTFSKCIKDILIVGKYMGKSVNLTNYMAICQMTSICQCRLSKDHRQMFLFCPNLVWSTWHSYFLHTYRKVVNVGEAKHREVVNIESGHHGEMSILESGQHWERLILGSG